ncbi:MAG: hypothetical protein HYY02_00995 [Chloroflexi bacterium]|nr:hypothetical protein [Chloroflexota bacterium]
MESARADEPFALALDFSGVQAASPSFFDELVAALGELKNGGRNTVRFLHPPASARDTFQAIGRGRGVQITETAPVCWEVELSTTGGGPR